MSDAFLGLADLTLAYGGTIAVEALSLAVRQGELVALLGPSGCGKTTTMRAIAGLLKPAGGRIELAGRDITRLAANRRGVGLVFQSYALFPHLSVWENVAFGLRLQKQTGTEIKRRVSEILADVGLAGFEDRLPRALSGGQQQRVALARSVVVRPKLLLLDEPLSNLDARLRLEMRSEISRLQRELGITMIYVTHDQAEALALADRIIVMRSGRIEQMDRPDAVYERPRSPFVARFMGFENTFSIAAGRLAGEAGQLTPSYEPPRGARALGWRPRAVIVGAGPHTGRVRGVSYLGQTVEYLIECPAGPIKAEVAADLPRYQPGEGVAFDLPLETAAIMEHD
jgi:putative spermidine/putrescine transport system ATP-binding protein